MALSARDSAPFAFEEQSDIANIGPIVAFRTSQPHFGGLRGFKNGLDGLFGVFGAMQKKTGSSHGFGTG